MALLFWYFIFVVHVVSFVVFAYSNKYNSCNTKKTTTKTKTKQQHYQSVSQPKPTPKYWSGNKNIAGELAGDPHKGPCKKCVTPKIGILDPPPPMSRFVIFWFGPPPPMPLTKVKGSLGVIKNKKISSKCQPGHHSLMSLLKTDWHDCFWVWILVQVQWTQFFAWC